MLVTQEAVQRRVFELCSLADAERHNKEMLLETAPGMSEPLIEPDFRTFAELECVDEVPLLNGTPPSVDDGSVAAWHTSIGLATVPDRGDDPARLW